MEDESASLGYGLNNVTSVGWDGNENELKPRRPAEKPIKFLIVSSSETHIRTYRV